MRIASLRWFARTWKRLSAQATNGLIVEASARRRLHVGDPVGYVDEVVDDVQPYFHEAFVNTTWPACPPIRTTRCGSRTAWWRCERIEEPIARLGELSGVNQEREG